MPLSSRGFDTQIFRITHYCNLDYKLKKYFGEPAVKLLERIKNERAKDRKVDDK